MIEARAALPACARISARFHQECSFIRNPPAWNIVLLDTSDALHGAGTAMTLSQYYIDSDIMRRPRKPVRFLASSLADLKGFPEAVRRNCGFQLSKLQRGEAPDDWKPMSGIGAGASEIRVHDDQGEFRVIYVAKFPDAIFVLHVFAKKTRKTPARDFRLAMGRYKILMARAVR